MLVESTEEAAHAIGLYQDPLKELYITLTRSDAWSPQMWRIDGGGVEHGETALQAAIREKKEEVGLTVTELQHFKSYGMPSRSPKYKTHFKHVYLGVIPNLDGFKVHAKDGEENLTNEIFRLSDVRRAILHRQLLSGYRILGFHAKIMSEAFSRIFGPY
jgi:ADP-ribose pyrophosphatase YjhB (NUDIX family)